MNKKQIIGGVVAVILLLSSAFFIKSCSKNKDFKDKAEALSNITDSLKTIVEEDSTLSTISDFVTDNLDGIFSKDSTVLALKQEVAKYKDELKNLKSVTTVGSTIKWKTRTKTEVIWKTAIDTIFFPEFKDSIVYVVDTVFLTPQYNSHFNLNGWVEGDVEANSDSTEVRVSVKDDFTIAIGEEKIGWFKTKPIATINSKNPYSRVQNFKTYQVTTPKKKRFGLGPYTGFSYDGEKIIPQIGIGLTFDVIQL